MTVEDQVYDEVQRKSGLTEADLAALIFGRQNGYQQRVNKACRQLLAAGRVVRKGKGGVGDPYRYEVFLKRRV